MPHTGHTTPKTTAIKPEFHLAGALSEMKLMDVDVSVHMRRSLFRLLSLLVPAGLMTAAVSILLCYVNQWDSLVFVTIIPVWIWIIGIIFCCLVSSLLFRSVPSYVLLFLSIVSLFLFPEESQSVFRDVVQDLKPQPGEDASNSRDRRIRLVSIHCRAGSLAAAREAARFEPDIVFFQKSPIRPELVEIASTIFSEKDDWALARSLNGIAILAKGEFVLKSSETDGHTLHARWRRNAKTPLIDLSNVDLRPCLPSLKMLWQKKERSRLTMARIANRRELRSFLQDYQADSPVFPPRIVAGNFATPARDDIFRVLYEKKFRDAFSERGDGWGNTLHSEQAYLRPDQAWSCNRLIPLRSYTAQSEHSGHRILITDFLLPGR